MQHLGDACRHLGQCVGQASHLGRIHGFSGLCEGQRKAGQHRELGGEGLGRGYADFRSGMGVKRNIRFVAHA